jgi:hypothetical protein
VTTTEAVDLVLDLTRQLARARSEHDVFRLIAQQAIHHAATLHRELTRVEERYHRLLDESRGARDPEAA